VKHQPVLLWEALRYLLLKPDGIYVDATVGGGGHALEILRRLTHGRLIALDLDPNALQIARETLQDHLERVVLVHANYRDLEQVLDELSIVEVDGVLMDLGLSSLQLADSERGFSFQTEAPLDMRFDPQNPLTARTIINEYREQDLRKILREYGEERFAARIAAEVVRLRKKTPIETTSQLVALIEKTIPKPAQRGYRQGRSLHPATRTFQALRIAVNDELGNVREGLEAAFRRLAAGGRLVVISFHSLEDRIVKRFMKAKAQGCICPPDFPICQCGRTAQAKIIGEETPSAEELSQNPRARSARLRALQKL